MKSRWLVLALVAGAGVASCGDDSDGDGSGGAGSSTGGSAQAGKDGSGGIRPSGGATPTGGKAATGGKAGTGGSETGGSAGDPGTSGSGGAAPQGGTSPQGGAPGKTSTCNFPGAGALAQADLPDGFCAWTFATDITRARGITVDSEGNVLVVSSGNVIALWDDDGDGVSGDDERATVASASGINHGIALNGGYLYASSPTTVYRWAYEADRSPLGTATTVITGIPSGGHSTRTLAFNETHLYVSVGSGSNVDNDSSRAAVRRFEIAELDSSTPFNEGELFAHGMRNEVGLRFDPQGRLWGVENGRDDLSRSDLGGDIHEDNPAEELNLFDRPAGSFYGYPYCWSEFRLDEQYSKGPGAQFADPEFMDDGTHTDAWCSDTDNVVPPVLAMQAHSAPLDLIFYTGNAFPESYAGDLFVTFHGSWNREEPTGYKVMHIPLGADGMPEGGPEPLLESSGPADDDWPHRPVGLAILPNGVLLVTSDESQRVIAIGYEP